MTTLRRLLLLGLSLLLPASALHADSRTDLARRYIREYSASRAHADLPSFSRQTGLACNACHTTFPQLTPFGRMVQPCWVSIDLARATLYL